MYDIAKNIKQLRMQKNLTQDALAEKLYVTRQTVSNYETGKSRPDIDMLTRIAQVLEVPIQDLLYEPEDLALVRKAQIKRNWILGGAAAAMLLLWVLLQKLAKLAVAYASSTYLLLPNMLVKFFLFPAYFSLLGLLIATALHEARLIKPVKKEVHMPLQATILSFIAIYAVLIGNMFLMTLPCGPLFPMRGVILFLYKFITNNHQNWLFLLFGLFLGITFFPKKKNTPDR